MKTWKELTTAERIDEIRRAYPQTIGTATRIAVFLSDKFGETISRNAVMGMYDRHRDALKDLPLSGENRMTVVARTMREAKPVKRKPLTIRPVVRKAEIINPPAPVDAEPADLPAFLAGPRPLLLTLFELGSRDCRWPVSGDGANTLFCGNLQVTGSSYCDCHKRMSIGRGTESERNAHKALKAVA